MTKWVQCRHQNNEKTVFVNLEKVAWIEDERGGCRIFFSGVTEDYVDVREKAEDILGEAPRG